MPATDDGRSRLASGMRMILAENYGDAAFDRLSLYQDLLVKWNRVFNLVARNRRTDVVSTHLLDSLSLYPLLGKDARVVDVGSGAGLPGLVLAAVMDKAFFHLVEPNQKKVAFLRQAIHTLGLANVVVYGNGIETLSLPAGALVVSRAYTSLVGLCKAVDHLQPAEIVAMKGVYPHEELRALPAWVSAQVIAVDVPGLAAQRHFIVMRKS
jgi:16S rRNA (guanine527-N7)-methyltransferase